MWPENETPELPEEHLEKQQPEKPSLEDTPASKEPPTDSEETQEPVVNTPEDASNDSPDPAEEPSPEITASDPDPEVSPSVQPPEVPQPESEPEVSPPVQPAEVPQPKPEPEVKPEVKPEVPPPTPKPEIKPDAQEKSADPVAATLVEETPDTKAESADPEKQQPAEKAEAEEEVAEEEAKEAVDTGPDVSQMLAGLAPLNKELLPKIETLISDREKRHQLLTDATESDLLHLMASYSQAEHIGPLIPKVGLVKRSYDALKYRERIAPEIDEHFRQSLAHFNKRRAAFQQQAEQAKVENSRRKKELLAQLKALVDKEDPLLIKEVRTIQDEWKRIGHVLREDIEPLYREYRFLLDKFYKLREMHFELLDYDRRINLQEKEKLIKEAEAKLIPAEEDRENLDVWREKMDILAEIQQQWKAIGHVPRENMDEINSAYRAVIDQFFDVRQGFVEIQDKLKEENKEKKEAILAQMAPFAEFNAPKPRAWNEATQQLRSHQEAWKQIGQAPQASNSELWGRYREICNAFFSKKAEFFRKFDAFRAENLAKKRELVEQAEALKDNEDLEKTARELKQLQQTWKQIGPVPERHSNKLWNRFRAACDAFFEKRRSHYSSQQEDESANLVAKQQLVDAVKKLHEEGSESPEAGIAKIKQLQAKWKEIGRVPYKEKDKIWESFRGAIDAFFDSLSLKREELRALKLRTTVDSIGDVDERGKAIRGKISRLRRRMSQSQEKVDQYGTNIQFISKGKSGDPLRVQIQAEIDKEIRVIEDLKKEIKTLNELLKNPPKKEEKAEAPQADKGEGVPAPKEEASAKKESPKDNEDKAEKSEVSKEAPEAQAQPEEKNGEAKKAPPAQKPEEEAESEAAEAETPPAEHEVAAAPEDKGEADEQGEKKSED